ncbi:MAG: hypothetical protein ABH864_07415 [archaeon]
MGEGGVRQERVAATAAICGNCKINQKVNSGQSPNKGSVEKVKTVGLTNHLGRGGIGRSGRDSR